MSVDENVGGVVAAAQVFVDWNIERDVLFFASVFNFFCGGIFDGLVLIMERASACNDFLAGLEQAYVDPAVSCACRYVSCYGEGNGEAGDVFAALGGLSVFLDGHDADSCGVKL